MKRRFPQVGEPGYGAYCKAAWRKYALWFWAYFPSENRSRYTR